jgi:hypothetical protein
MPVEFTPAALRSIKKDSFLYKGFGRPHISLIYYIQDKKQSNLYFLGAILHFSDQAFRTTHTMINLKYIISDQKITVKTATLKQLYPENLRIVTFIIPSDKINTKSMNSFTNHISLLHWLLENDYLASNRILKNSNNKSYYIFAANLDRIPEKLKLAVRISNSPNGTNGSPENCKDYSFDGWHIAYIKAKLNFFSKPPFYIKSFVLNQDGSTGDTNIIDSTLKHIKSNSPLQTTSIRETPALKIFSVSDSYVYAYNYRNWNRSNRGGSHQLMAGWHPTGGESRAFIKFNLNSIDKNQFKKAVLSLYHFQHTGNDKVKLGIYRVSDDWAEGSDIYHSGKVEQTASPGTLSWEQQPPSDSNLIASFNPGTKMRNYINIDITSLVRQWLNGKENYGLEIKPIPPFTPTTPESFQFFASKERDPKLDIPKGVNKAPALLIFYKNTIQKPPGNTTKTQSKQSDKHSKELKLPFTGNFSATNKNWTLPENAEIKNGQLSWHTGSGTNLLKLNKKIPFENICIEFDGMSKKNGFNIHLVNDKNIGYIWILGGWYNTQSGSDIGLPAEQRKLVTGKLWTPGKWNHYKVSKIGRHLKGFCNNNLIFDRITEQKYQGLGNLFFDSWNTIININNIKIYKPQ